jgi:hypothetical protein
MFEECSVCGCEDAELKEITEDGDAIFLCENCVVEDLVDKKSVNLSKFIWKEVL